MIDPASIPVERYWRHAKTDRLDAIKLVTNLRAGPLRDSDYLCGPPPRDPLAPDG